MTTIILVHITMMWVYIFYCCHHVTITIVAVVIIIIQEIVDELVQNLPV